MSSSNYGHHQEWSRLLSFRGYRIISTPNTAVGSLRWLIFVPPPLVIFVLPPTSQVDTSTKKTSDPSTSVDPRTDLPSHQRKRDEKKPTKKTSDRSHVPARPPTRSAPPPLHPFAPAAPSLRRRPPLQETEPIALRIRHPRTTEPPLLRTPHQIPSLSPSHIKPTASLARTPDHGSPSALGRPRPPDRRRSRSACR